MLPKFYPILDTAVAEKCGAGDLVTAASQILEGGARILQFRHKGLFTREIFSDMERIASLCADCSAKFMVNDRADLAALLHAGLHLGQDDLPAASARMITGDTALLGFSTHNEKQLRAAAEEPVDYLALGPIFGTSSKE